MRRIAFLLLTAVVAATVPARPAAAADVAVLVIEGKGWGHGVGLSQRGAFSLARKGLPLERILGQFYPGTSVGRASGFVRVPVLSSPGRQAIVSFPNGGEVRDAISGTQSPGFPLKIPAGGQVRLSFDGQYHAQRVGPGLASARRPASLPTITTPTTSPPVLPSTTTTTRPNATTTTTQPAGGGGTTTPTTTRPGSTVPGGTVPPGTSGTTTAPAAAPVATSAKPLFAVPATGGTVSVDSRGRRYRGFMSADASRGPLRLVNQVDIEDYLRGMGEVRDPSWPLPALQAQAIAARTYALRAMKSVGEICEDTRCQVYLGQQVEYAAMDRAVSSTQGRVVLFGGQLASTVYSANGGGFEATPEEGFGSTGPPPPYLRAAPYETVDPMPWTVRVALGDVAARLGYGGQLEAVEVTKRGPSGRALEVTMTGSAGSKTVNGRAFDANLGLRSTLFTLRLEKTVAPPPPPPPLDPAAPDQQVQALPEQAPTDPSPEVEGTVAAPEPRQEEARPVPEKDDGGSDRAPAIVMAVLLLAGAVGGSTVLARRIVRRRQPLT